MRRTISQTLTATLAVASIALTAAAAQGTFDRKAKSTSTNHPVELKDLKAKKAPKGQTVELAQTRSMAKKANKLAEVSPASRMLNRKAHQGPSKSVGSLPIRAALVYSDAWDEPEYGLYDIPTQGQNFEPIFLADGMAGGAGSCHFDGNKFFSYHLVTFWGMVLSADMYVYDIETGDVIGYNPVDTSADFYQYMNMVEDPTTGTIYAMYIDLNQGNKYFGTFNTNTYKPTQIAEWNTGTSDDALQALMATKEGQLYGVTSAMNLVTIDKTTGAQTLIGNLGVANDYITSGAIDPKSGTCYFASITDEESILWEVDLQTAGVTMVNEFNHGEEFVGMYVAAPSAEDGAPDTVTNLNVTFPGAEFEGTVSFTMPTATFDGNAGTGALSYTVLVNGAEAASASAAWGENVTVPVSVSHAGQYTINVLANNSVGNGPKMTWKGWIGNDVPTEVSNVVADWTAGTMTITWAPAEAANGGYFDPSAVTYTVYNADTFEVIASGLTATQYSYAVDMPESYTTYQYAVAATFAGTSSATVFSNIVGLGEIEAPYTLSFADEDSWNLVTVINANGDAKQWSFTNNGYAQIGYNSSAAMDDYLVMPGVKVEAGKAYVVTFTMEASSANYHERFEVLAGTTATVEGLNKVLVEPTDLLDNSKHEFSAYYFAEYTGKAFFAVHGISDADMFNLRCYGFSISAPVSTETPAKVEDLTAVANADGDQEVTLTMVAPALNIGGTALNSLSGIRVLRNGEMIATVEATPGQEVTYVDDNANGAMLPGNNSYSVYAYNAGGEGQAVSTTVFVGVPAPAKVNQVYYQYGDNMGQILVSWDKVFTSAEGAPIADGKVSYKLSRVINQESTEIYNGTDNAYTDQAVAADAPQEFVYYLVEAYTTGGTAAAANTTMIPAGQPDSTPWYESGQLDHIMGLSSAGGAKWALYTQAIADPVDEDGVLYACQGQYANQYGDLFTGNIAIGDLPAPVFSFYYYNYASENTLQVYVKQGEELTLLDTVTLSADEEEGWVKKSVSLADYQNQDLQLYLRANIVTTTLFVIDDLRVESMVDNNLTARGIKAPSKVQAGDAFEVQVSVANNGALEANDYSVELYLNNELAATVPGTAVAPSANATVTFMQSAPVASTSALEYYAKVVYTLDEVPADNTTKTVSVQVTFPKFPTVELSGAEQEDGVLLTWNEPNLSAPIPVETTDTLEDYPSFSNGMADSAIEDDTLGDWVTFDLVGSPKYGIQGANFPNQYKGAWMIMDAPAAGLTNEAWAGHNSDKAFACFANEAGLNDDWLISPELCGAEQNIGFFAKTAIDQYGLEAYEVWVSSTDRDVASFTKIAANNSVPNSWTEYIYTVPEGTKFFAIRCVSPDRFCLMVDDITFTPAPEIDPNLSLIGYNVYRDGELLNEEPILETEYLDTTAVNGANYNYVVTVVYNMGQSAPSNVFELNPTAVAEFGIARGIRAERNAVVINGFNGQMVTVSNAAGVVVFSGKADASTRVEVAAGVYMVKAGNTVAKLIVR